MVADHADTIDRAFGAETHEAAALSTIPRGRDNGRTVMKQRAVRLGWMAVLAGLSAAGCIERRETITVDAGGGAAVHVEFETQSFSELYEGDAIPSV